MSDQLFFEELSDGICVSDAQGYPLYLNSAAERMLEHDAKKPKSQICHLLCGRFTGSPNHYPAACPLREHGSLHKAVTNGGRFGTRDLRVRCVRLTTAQFDSWEIEKHFTVIEDATAEMSLERTKDDWRNMVAHDLSNPLTTIYGSLKVLEEMPVGYKLQEEDKNIIAICTRTCQRMNQMLEQFLQVARLESGLMPVRPEIIPLALLVKECLNEQAGAASEKKIKLELALPEKVAVRGDRYLLSRVVQNLLSNALKFTPEGGRVTISLIAGDDGGTVTLGVRDTGPGISHEDLPYVFDRFYQTRERKERKVRGNGLGLAFCRQAMTAMGGEILVESAPRLGSEFILKLPRVAEGAAPAQPRKAAKGPDSK